MLNIWSPLNYWIRIDKNKLINRGVYKMVKFRKANALFAALLGIALIYMEVEYRKTHSTQRKEKS